MKYPNGYFKSKPCRVCKTDFGPTAPSDLYCSEVCKEDGHDHAYLMRTYGIRLADYRDMQTSQKGGCAICGNTGFKMRAHHRKTLVVDHCHKSGEVRGLLCHNCNRALGLLSDDTGRLRTAIEYLEAHREGATTIPKGSTPEANAGGSARPQNILGEDIVWTRRRRLAA